MPSPTQWLGDTIVNTGAAAVGGQTDPKVIGLSNGNILVAYVEDAAGAISGANGTDIIGRLYDAEGVALGGAFRLNTNRTDDDEGDFDIAAASDGGFYMAYVDEAATINATTVVLERFNAAGTQIGVCVLDTESSSGALVNPRIAVNTNPVGNQGNHLFVTWEEQESSGDVNLFSAYLLEDLTVAAGSPFSAAQNSGDPDRDHESAILTTGELATVVEEVDSSNVSLEVFVYSTAGNRTHQNINFTFAPVAIGEGFNPRMASLTNGSFVVVWNDAGDISARLFDSSALILASISAEVSMNTATGAVVAGLPDGGFVIAWDNDTDDVIELRRYNADGSADGGTVAVSIQPGATRPDLGVTGDGRILVTYQGPDISYTIWDPRDPATIDSSDYAGLPDNFIDTDVVTGGPGASTIVGEDGADTLIGAGAGDSIVGAGGSDLLRGNDGNDLLQGHDGDDSLFGGNASDTLHGHLGADLLHGDGGDDELNGGGGADTLQGEAGNDTLNGDDGDDTADYSYSSAGSSPTLGGWTIDLGAGSAEFFQAVVVETDTLASLENVVGSGWGDLIVGDDGSNLLQGMGGNDTFVMRDNNGLDTFAGGLGTDTLVSDLAWIDNTEFDMPSGEIRASGAIAGRFSGIENLTVGGGADVAGDGADNRIIVDDIGATSTNTINGGAGDDTIDAGIGSDSVSGGADADTIIDRLDGGMSTLGGGSGTDRLDLSGAAQGFVLNESGAVTAGSTTLSLSSFEALDGTDFADDIYEFGNLNTIVAGAGDDTVRGIAQALDVFDGGAGIDTYIDTGGISSTIDLLSETVNSVNNLRGFENAFAGSNDDTIRGTDDANALGGNGGHDLLEGLAGNDLLEGLAGNDVLMGGLGDDTLSGGADNDTLNGDGGTDRLFGGGGDDLFVYVLGWGQSNAFGGIGTDTVDFSAVGAGGGFFDIDLNTGITIGTGALNSTFSSIENATGSQRNDLMTGTAGANFLEGQGGNDTLNGLGGTDTLSGGGGDDTFVYEFGWGQSNAFGGIGTDTVDFSAIGPGGGVFGIDLNTGISIGGALNSTFSSIENATGTQRNDDMLGTNGDNLLRGGGGNDTVNGFFGDDTVSGGGGNDVLIGSAGDDDLYGGLGFDRFVLAVGADVVHDFQDDIDALWLREAIWGGGLSIPDVFSTYGSVSGGDTVLDFGNGSEVFIIEGVTNMTTLYNDVVLF